MTPANSRALAALSVGLALFAWGCSDGNEPQVPGSLQVVAGNAQTAAAGTAVPIPPAVKLLSTAGKPMAGIEVNFAASADGQVLPVRQTTDAQGVATLSSWTLPRRAGSHQLTVTTTGVPALVLTATASAGAAAKITRVSPEQNTGTVGGDVAFPPIVLVSDAHDNPVPGIAVSFATSSNGRLRVASATTDATGTARSEGWTLGTVAGLQTVQAVVDVPNVAAVTFTAIANAAAPARLEIVTQPATSAAAGIPLQVQPVIDIQDTYGNRVLDANSTVTALLEPGSNLTLSGATAVQAMNGRATFRDLTVNAAGSVRLRFVTNGLPEASSAAFNVPAVSLCPGAVMALNFTVGQSARFVSSAANTPLCFDFSTATNTGHQYLVQIENMAMSGNSDTGVFPGLTTPQSSFDVTISTGPGSASSDAAARVAANVPATATDSWDFGAGPIYEIEPTEPVGGARPAMLLRGGRADVVANSAAIVVGDTILANMEGIPRLGIPNGQQKAVVRYVTPDVIIAEDVRLPTLPRQGGGTNTPLTLADMEAIAADYSAYAKVQADRFFGGRYNATIEATHGRPIAIHSLMYADNIWGYTYPSGNYFVWDFWVGTNGANKGVNQQIEFNSNNLFMHEIAHMRHWGMNERAGRAVRGNRWLVEGFARASERWPIAMRLLGTATPSRTGNIVLPRFPVNQMNSLADVPPYTQTSASMYAGYHASSYVFDYFADQVARTTTTDWMTALGEFLVNAGVESDLNTVVGRYLPGVDFGTLFTRARIAFYLDDLASGLPDWTQYHQFQLRASRATLNPQVDPRNLWPKIVPGTPFSDARPIFPGAAFAYIIDGTSATANTRIMLGMPQASYGVLSVTRIK